MPNIAPLIFALLLAAFIWVATHPKVGRMLLGDPAPRGSWKNRYDRKGRLRAAVRNR